MVIWHVFLKVLALDLCLSKEIYDMGCPCGQRIPDKEVEKNCKQSAKLEALKE